MVCAQRFSKTGVALAILLTGSMAVQAGFSPVYTVPGSEYSHAQVLQAYFSPQQTWSAFARQGGSGESVDYTNGTLSAWRLDDTGPAGVFDVHTTQVGQATDQTWSGGPVTVRAIGRFAMYDQSLAYESTGGRVELFSVTGTGTEVQGTGAVNTNAAWTWSRSGLGGGWSSDPAQNADGLDHVVSYQINGLDDGLSHWLLFFEDLEGLGDRDYNDMVVEVTAPLPEPASAILFGLAALLLRRRG